MPQLYLTVYVWYENTRFSYLFFFFKGYYSHLMRRYCIFQVYTHSSGLTSTSGFTNEAQTFLKRVKTQNRPYLE